MKSATFNFPLICVGNLAVGGTGKTPMVEYLVELLKDKYTIATLSRGYKRKTKGFGIADEQTTALEIGDEPMQFHQKFPDVTIAVGEERLVAIPQLLQEKPDTEVIILDDAFQHRQVQAGLNIILTEYKNLYTRDFLMPAGDLRDNKSSAKRADIILVTKCKQDLSEREKDALLKELKPGNHQRVFFTQIEYGTPYHMFNKASIQLQPETEILLICGIANPKPIKELLNKLVHTYEMIRYPDHHIFNMDDLSDIEKQFSKLSARKKIILTTEKDAVRLQKFKQELLEFPIYILPIKHSFLFDQANEFNRLVEAYIQPFAKEK